MGEGQGSTFTVELPLRKLSGIAMDKRPALSTRSGVSLRISSALGNGDVIFASESKGSELSSRRVFVRRLVNKRMLLVDDATTSRKMMAKLLTKEGAVCVQAQDGQEALDLFDESVQTRELFDVILMDYQMPVMDGPTAIKALREKGYKGVVIGVTGNVLPCDKITMLEAGANNVLEKPFDINMFVDILSESRCSFDSRPN